MKRYTTHKLSKSDKQLKRIKQLKRELANAKKEIDNLDTSRVLARKELCFLKDYFIQMSRSASELDAKIYWLKKTRPINFILALSMSKEEFDREWEGKDVYPDHLKYTDEEKELIKDKQDDEPSAD